MIVYSLTYVLVEVIIGHNYDGLEFVGIASIAIIISVPIFFIVATISLNELMVRIFASDSSNHQEDIFDE